MAQAGTLTKKIANQKPVYAVVTNSTYDGLCYNAVRVQELELVGNEAIGPRAHRCLELVDRLAVARHVPELRGLTLVAHDRHRQRPTLTGLADHVRRRHPSTIEQHLTELAADPVDHPQRPLLDPRLFRLRGFATGSASLLVLFMVMFGIFLVILQYLQLALGYSALKSAVALLPLIFVMIPTSAADAAASVPVAPRVAS